MTLYLSRKLRFDDYFFERYDKLFRLSHDMDLKILEIGCGLEAIRPAHSDQADKATSAVNKKIRRKAAAIPVRHQTVGYSSFPHDGYSRQEVTVCDCPQTIHNIFKIHPHTIYKKHIINKGEKP